jgi:hypothetical protein
VRSGWSGRGAVPPEERHLEQAVEIWPSASALQRGKAPIIDEAEDLADLVETAVTRYAPIAEPESLARILARQARRAKADLPDQFSNAVGGLLDDFGKALGITFEGPDGEEFFRSSLIQTAFYGLFAGWALWRFSGSRAPFHWEDLGTYLKIPFLGELFYEFRHPARIRELRLAKHLDIATETLLRVDSERFFARFHLPSLQSAATGEEDVPTAAIVYFYEPFLEAFDPELRKELGVWYTPPEIVQYQVRKVDRLLRDELGCHRGFADDNVVVLDPCCGTGAYLIEVMRCIADQLQREGEEALLGARLLNIFCNRVIGFEILTAPFVIAQLQLYLILSRLGAIPGNGDRPAVFLTNALTGWHQPEQLKLHFPELQQEHDAAQKIKTAAKIIVILGNPPYNRFAGVPVKEEADLVDHYKGIRRDDKGRQIGSSVLYDRWGIRKHLLDDLYIRFFRLAEMRIGERAEFGIVSFISNYSFLNGRSHPILRESFLKTFQSIWIDSLNGDKYRTGKVIPKGLPGAGTTDQSIFTTDYDQRGIQVGTCITTLLKARSVAERKRSAGVLFREFWGRATGKRAALLESLEMNAWPEKRKREASSRPEGPREYEQLQPSREGMWKLIPRSVVGGVEDWPALDELFPIAYQGVNPNRGLQGSIIDIDRNALKKRMLDYFSSLSFSELATRHPELCKGRARYEPKTLRERLHQVSGFCEKNVVPYVLFPMDLRWIYYETEGKLLNERRPELWENLEGNEFLISVPQPRRHSEVLPVFATCLFDLHLHDRGSVGFPAEVQPPGDLFSDGGSEKVANLAPQVAQALAKAWNLPERMGEATNKLCRDLFRICLALCHSPRYREDNRDALAHDWAHIPVPKDHTLFETLVKLGDKIAVLLDPLANAENLVSKLLGKARAQLAVIERLGGGAVQQKDLVVSFSYYGAASGRWQERRARASEPWYEVWGETTGDLFLNENVYFRNVPEGVWRYELGGYPVLKKWLGYRDNTRKNGTPLTLDEASWFRGMVCRLAALLLLHDDLDLAYEQAIGDAWTSEELGLA